MNDPFRTADLPASPQAGAAPWRRARLAATFGRCTNDSLALADGLTLVYTHYSPDRDLLEASAVERDTQCLTLTIALEGHSSTLATGGQRFDFVSGHSTITAFASVHSERHFPAGQPARQLRLIADEPLLHRYGLASLLEGSGGNEGKGKNQSARQLFFGKYGGATRGLAASLVHLHGHGGGLLDLQIAALGLLSEQTRPFAPPPRPVGRIRSADQDRILSARELLVNQFERPLTIAYLCAAVGTNEFKLKQGFRELFGTSPHRLLTDIRMAKAWELLETGLHVSTVAYRVGYQHLSSFSAAFERYYGRPPKSVAGARRHAAASSC